MSTKELDTRQAADQGHLLPLVVNGEAAQARAATLAALIEELGYAGMKVATALNGDFVPERARVATAVAAGDRIEIVAPRQGG